MKRWKPKYFIIYTYIDFDKMGWPDDAPVYCCMGNLSTLLQHELNIQTIGSEIKLIWNWQHRQQVLKDNDITNDVLEKYLKSNCTILSFAAEGTMNRALKVLIKLGLRNMVCANSYREMILQQAHYQENKVFKD